jgi:hypothetical protein
LIVYTAFRAIKLDRGLPWFTSKSKQEELKPKKGARQ